MTLDELRLNINRIDEQILNLLKERVSFVKKVGELKNKENSKIYVPSREKQIFEKLEKINNTGLNNKAIISIFTEIISACREVEKPLSVSYLGPENTFTNFAAIKQFGSTVSYIPLNSIDAVFESVEHNESDYGVVPVENSTEGTVNYTLDKFMNSNLKIVAELELKISHSISSTNIDFKNIKRIYSHPQSFGQCKNWIFNHMKNVELINVSSNSLAAKMAKEDKDGAAIGPKIAAKAYDLNILEENIQDFSDNTTRFLVIGKELNETSGYDKTSIMFSPKEKIGALYESLKHFSDNKINLSMIESRPSKRKSWQYVFFLDFEGYYKDENIKKALESIENISTEFKILGSYPNKKI